VSFEGQHPLQLGHGRNLVGLGIGGDLRQHQPLLRAHAHTLCRADLPLARSNERRQNLAVDGRDSLQLLEKLRHKLLKRIAKLIAIQIVEQPAERVAARHTVWPG
jgi:hypothetical protein